MGFYVECVSRNKDFCPDGCYMENDEFENFVKFGLCPYSHGTSFVCNFCNEDEEDLKERRKNS